MEREKSRAEGLLAEKEASLGRQRDEIERLNRLVMQDNKKEEEKRYYYDLYKVLYGNLTVLSPSPAFPVGAGLPASSRLRRL